MIGAHRPGWIACTLIVLAAILEFALGFCCLRAYLSRPAAR
jgi:hypothetical protein